MLWERENKRGYQFEDGEVRVFARPYFELLQPAENPDPVLRHQLREQAVANGEIEPVRRPGATGGRAAAPLPNLDDQVTVFDELFPDGFAGERWLETHRSRIDGRRLKRHRDPAIVEAAQMLDADTLRGFVEAGNHDEVYRRVVEVVEKTDLATRKQLDVFRTLSVDAELARAMVDFLHGIRHGELAAMPRLRRALARQGVRKIPWNVLTAPRALLHPHDHLCVRSSVIRAQAKLIAPRFKPSTVPSAAEYSRCLEIAMGVRKHLTECGCAPRDLFDVAQFMKVTLAKPAQRSLIQAMTRRRAIDQASAEEDRAGQSPLAAARPVQ